MSTIDITLRPATHEDYDDVAAFTSDTWGEGSDYIPDIYHDWIEGDDKRTIVADTGEDIAGIAQAVLLSEHEAWAQGMRVNPAYRGQGVSTAITEELFNWARGQGRTVIRAMVFSWNQAGLGQARASGYDPATEFRWLQPDPDPDQQSPDGYEVVTDPDAAWSYWIGSDACSHLRDLALSLDESWAVQELTRDLLHRAADEQTVFAVQTDSGTVGASYRTRTYERENDEGVEQQWAEYGIGAWERVDAADALLAAIAADAAALGADRTRVLIPETARAVSDGALLRAGISEDPDFVVAADLTRASTNR